MMLSASLPAFLRLSLPSPSVRHPDFSTNLTPSQMRPNKADLPRMRDDGAIEEAGGANYPPSQEGQAK